MYTELSRTEHIARKIHTDDGFGLIAEAYSSFHFGPSNMGIPMECFGAIKDAYLSEQAHIIRPGERYIRICATYDGDFSVFKTKTSFYQLIDTLSLWNTEG